MIDKNFIPILEYDDSSKEVIAPDHGAESLKLPEKLIFAFLGETVDDFAEKLHAEVVENIETVTKNYPIYVVKDKGIECTLVQAPLGGSASAQILDGLIACGCKKIIAAGSCGVISELDENEFLIPVRALRDEGTSYKYLPAERYVSLDSKMIADIERTFADLNIPYAECTTWTTDGFFRETEDMVLYRKEEGCTCVEMECASLAACALKRGAQFGQFLYTADSLTNVKDYDERGWGKNSLEKALEICFRIIENI